MKEIKYKILIIGCGSIGMRHFNNLINIGEDDIILFDVEENTRKGLENKGKAIFDNLDLAFLCRPDIVFICSPTIYHESHIKMAIEHNCHIFVEKPISTTSKNLSLFLSMIKRKKLKTMVGFNNRYMPLLINMKNCVDNNTFGKILFVDAEVGYSLAKWRPNTDYSKSYSASKSQGGGALFDWCHEIDYLNWIFGDVKEVFCTMKRLNKKMKYDIDDFATIIMKTSDDVIINLKLDCIRQGYTRKCTIVGEYGMKTFDFGNSIINNKYKYDSTYIYEIIDFLKSIDDNKPVQSNFKNGVEVQKIMDACIESSNIGEWVKVR